MSNTTICVNINVLYIMNVYKYINVYITNNIQKYLTNNI